MNEILRRALLQAQLSEEDVAARLAVDPKTVRRWTEGRVPYLRHRWELARLLDCDEADLWPQFGAAKSRPDEILAVYPHRETVPIEIWQNLFGSAEQDIGILAASGAFIAGLPVVIAKLSDQAQAGVRVRICLHQPDYIYQSCGTLEKFLALRESGSVEVRVHKVNLPNAIYRGDDDLLISQYACGIPSGQMPVLHLRRVRNGEIATTYLESFENAWTNSRHVA